MRLIASIFFKEDWKNLTCNLSCLSGLILTLLTFISSPQRVCVYFIPSNFSIVISPPLVFAQVQQFSAGFFEQLYFSLISFFLCYLFALRFARFPLRLLSSSVISSALKHASLHFRLFVFHSNRFVAFCLDRHS